MFENLMFVGKVRFALRYRLAWDAVRVMWYAINGWQMAGWKANQQSVEPIGGLGILQDIVVDSTNIDPSA